MNLPSNARIEVRGDPPEVVIVVTGQGPCLAQQGEVGVWSQTCTKPIFPRHEHAWVTRYGTLPIEEPA